MSDTQSRIDELMNFDSIAEAEQITGERYGQKMLALGMLLNISKNEQLNHLMDQTGDTKFSENYARYCTIAESIGFEQIYEENFAGRTYGDSDPRTETFRVFWHPEGALLTVESYGENVNTAKMYYNVRFEEGKDWITSSGGCAYTDHGVWSGDHDVREGLKHTFNKIRASGEFLATWIDRPFVWFLNYMDTEDKDYDYRAINASKIAQFPQEVQDAITPKYCAQNTPTGDITESFDSVNDVWNWIKDNMICEDCYTILQNGGYWREATEADSVYFVENGQYFERVHYVDQTSCGKEWVILAESQLITIIK